MSLRIKTFISFLLITLLPAGVLLSLNYYQARSHFEATAFDTLRDQAKELAERLDVFIASHMYLVQHLSQDAYVAQFLLASDEQQAKLRATVNAWLDVQAAVNPSVYSALYVMDTQGNCLASSQRDFIGQNYTFRPYFQDAMRGQVALTDLFVGVTSNLPGIYTAAPILGNDRIVGVLVLKLNADGIFQSVALQRTAHLQWYVLNRMGIILTHTESRYRYHSLVPLSSEQQSEIRQIQQFAGLTPAALNVPELHQTLFSSPLDAAVTLSFPLGNTSRIGGFAPLTTEDWIVSVSRPTSEIYAFLSDLIATTLLVAIISLVVIGLAAYGLSTYVLVTPLTRLLMAVERIQQGHYAHRIKITSHDEIGQLANSFNAMIQSLQHSEQDYRTLFEHLPVGVYRNSTEQDGKALRANPALIRMLGLDSPQEFIQFPIADYYHDQNDRTRFIERIARNGSVNTLETVLKKKDGTTFWAAITATAGSDENGDMRWVDGIIIDISERKRAESELRNYQEHLEELVQERTHALQASEERFSSFMNHLPVIAFITDLEERLVYINAAGARLAKASADVQAHPALDALFSSARAERYLHEHRHILLTGQATQFEETVNDAQEVQHWLTYTFPIRNQAGETTFVGSISVNITGRKQAEEQARQAQHAAEDAQERAEKAQRASDAANRAKSAFLATMSHELRTPLNAILGYTQLFRHDQALAKPYRQAMNTIHYSGEHLLELINDILDFSKIEAQHLELQPAAFSLSTALHTIVEMMRVRAEQKGIAFHADVDDTLPAVLIGDERRLKQIILNIISNAIKFTSHGSVTFTVTPAEGNASPSSQAGPGQTSTLQFSISDTGVGISAEKLEEVFEPFQQIQHPHLKSEGTGLGLSISRRLTALMGGTLHVQSTPGQGSRFWFTLEFQVDGQRVPSDEMVPPDVGAIRGYHGPMRKVCIVSDQPQTSELLQVILRNWGFDVCATDAGHAALTQAQKHHPDCILLELMLPESRGQAIFQRIQAIPALQNVPVVAISDHVNEEIRQQWLQQGFRNVLLRPVPLDNLLRLLQEYLKLEWQYTESDGIQPGEPVVNAPLQLPSRRHMHTLHDLAKRGNPQEIAAYVDGLIQEEPVLQAFGRKITDWLAEYRIQQVYDYVRQCLENDMV